MAKLVLFINEEEQKEYVVILTEGDVSEHCLEGYKADDEQVELDNNDVSVFPCDRPLFARH